MYIFVNDARVECREQTTISGLLSQQGITPVNIAVAMNNTVVPRSEWETTIIEENCNIIIIKAVQGG